MTRALHGVVLIFILNSFLAGRGWTEEDHTLGRDTQNMFKLTGIGFVNQFQHLDSILWMGATAGGSYALMRNDGNLQQGVENANVLGTTGENIGDVGGYALNIGIVGLYPVARAVDNEKFTTFSIETLSTHLMVLIEVAGVSHIPTHNRPNIEKGNETLNSNSINDIFRGDYSFPSGHIVGAAVLTFKGSEYYGWKMGVPAALATGYISWARVEQGDHYVSDIFCTIGMAGIASLSTSRKRSIITTGIETSDGGWLRVAPVFLGLNNWSLGVTRTF